MAAVWHAFSAGRVSCGRKHALRCVWRPSFYCFCLPSKAGDKRRRYEADADLHLVHFALLLLQGGYQAPGQQAGGAYGQRPSGGAAAPAAPAGYGQQAAAGSTAGYGAAQGAYGQVCGPSLVTRSFASQVVPHLHAYSGAATGLQMVHALAVRGGWLSLARAATQPGCVSEQPKCPIGDFPHPPLSCLRRPQRSRRAERMLRLLTPAAL